MAFDPFKQTNLRHELAQGANVGDIRGYGADKYRWSGVQWEKEGGGSPSFSFQSDRPKPPTEEERLATARRFAQQQADLVKPYTDEIKAGIPIVEQKFESAKQYMTQAGENLKKRYDDLLANVKQKEQVAAQGATTAQAQELAKRGILPSSSIYQQQVQKALLPVQAEFGGITAELGSDRESALLNAARQVTTLAEGAATEAQRIREKASEIVAKAMTTGNARGLDEATMMYQQALQYADALQRDAKQAWDKYMEEKRYSEIDYPESQSKRQTEALERRLAQEPDTTTSDDSRYVNEIIGRGQITPQAATTYDKGFTVSSTGGTRTGSYTTSGGGGGGGSYTAGSSATLTPSAKQSRGLLDKILDWGRNTFINPFK